MTVPSFRSSSPCPGCGGVDFHTEYAGEVGTRMKQTGECFDCAFWEIEASKPQPVVIDHHTYCIGPEPPKGERRGFLGMGGRRFDIEFFDGRKVTTHNLWSGGTIPERFRDRIPDTARFAGGAERVKVGEITCWNHSREVKEGVQ